jgi:hypothetical protein
MMREILSGTSESSKVKMIRVNTNTDWLRKLKKRLIGQSTSSEWGADPTKKSKKRFGRLK